MTIRMSHLADILLHIGTGIQKIYQYMMSQLHIGDVVDPLCLQSSTHLWLCDYKNIIHCHETCNHIFHLVTLTFDLDLQGRPLTLTHMTFGLDPCDH